MLIGIDASRANRLMRTGTEWYSFYLIKELAKLDKNNKYILYLDKEPFEDLRQVIADKKNWQFKVLKWPWSYFWTLGRLSLEMLFKKPDILFVPAHGLPFFCPKKTITTIHDIAFKREEKVYRREKIKTKKSILLKLSKRLITLFSRGNYQANSLDYLDWSTNRSLKVAKKIIAVSQFTKNDLLKYYNTAKAEKIVVIHNGYNQEKYNTKQDKKKAEEILNKYGIIKPYFLYVGRLEKKKNTPRLLEAFSLIKENYPDWPINLVLVGKASYGYDEVKYVIEDYHLSPLINMPGWIDDDDMVYIYQSSLAFIFPTKHEGFGIPVLEAMASETPTVISDLPVLREVAGNASLFFDQNNVQAISEALIKIYQDESLRLNLKEKGLKRVEQFSWQKTANLTLDLINKL